MKITYHYARVISGSVPAVTALIFDFDRIWPTDIVAAPRPLGRARYKAGPMVWEEVDSPERIRSFRVISPADLCLEHWFEAASVDGGTLLQHTLAGEAAGSSVAILREQIAPIHDGVIEALFDNVEAAISSGLEK